MLTSCKKFLQHDSAKIVIIILLGLITYSFMLTDSFKTLDDYGTVVHNPRIKSITHLKEIFTSSHFGVAAYYRPMLQASFMMDYHLFGLHAFYYYITNILYHLLVAVFVFLLMKELVDDPHIPFFVALLFAIHPVHWITVSMITGRSSSIIGLFYVASVFFYCRFKNHNDKYLYYVVSLICFVFALLSRETALSVPVILFSYLIFVHFKNVKQLLRDAVQLIPFIVFIFVYFLFRQSLGIMRIFQQRTFEDILFGFLTFLRAVMTHLRLFILPVDLHFDRTRALFTGVNVEVILTVAFFMGLAYLIYRLKSKISKKRFLFLKLVLYRSHSRFPDSCCHSHSARVYYDGRTSFVYPLDRNICACGDGVHSDLSGQ